MGGAEEDDHPLLASSRELAAACVYDEGGRRLGMVRHLVVRKPEGAARYAVVSFGGRLDMGERRYPLPWHLLAYDERLNGYVLGLAISTLQAAPYYLPGREPIYDPIFEMRICDYWASAASMAGP